MKRQVKFFMKASVAVLILALIVSASVLAAPAKVKKPTIALVMKSLAAEFFKTMEEGAIEYQQSRGDFYLLPLGMKTQADIDQQVEIVENLVVQKVDAIVIAPADSQALVPPLAKAAKSGIKVINIDVELDKPTMKKNGIDLAFVGPDNTGASKMVGDALAKELGPGGKVIIIEGNPGASNAQQRKDGFMESVKAGKLNLLASRTAHWETEEAFTVFSNLLTAHPDVQGVMCANDAMAIGVVQAIAAAGKTGQVKVVGFDNDAAIRPLIKDGKVIATIDQFGPKMAIFGIDYALDAIKGKPLKGWIKTPVKVITKDTL
jgi:ribose transport system substrate-binding protein